MHSVYDDFDFFLAIGFEVNERGQVRDAGLRGFPDFISTGKVGSLNKDLYDEYEDLVTWFSTSELHLAMEKASIDEHKLQKTLRMFLAAVRLAAKFYGDERVRVVFAIER